MTAATPKTKRDRSAGRRARHTAIQTIIDNHNQDRADIDSLDNSVAALQDETCYLGSKLVVWTDHLEKQNKHAREDIAYTMMRVIDNERRLAETETAVGILQGAGKDQHKALTQLDRYTKRLHAKQTSQNRELTIVQADLAELEKKFIALAWICLGIWVAAALTIFILLLI